MMQSGLQQNVVEQQNYFEREGDGRKEGRKEGWMDGWMGGW